MKNESGSMTYPRKGTLNRLLFKGPLIWWRMGLGSILSHEAMSGSKMLVLTTWGRKSNMPRHTMLSYSIFKDNEYVASGWGDQTDWYKNFVENPSVTVQVGRKVYSAHARRVTDKNEFEGVGESLFESGGDSHFSSWLESMEIEHELQDLIAKRERVYFVGLDQNDESGPPPLKADLKWLWVIMLIILIGIWMIF